MAGRSNIHRTLIGTALAGALLVGSPLAADDSTKAEQPRHLSIPESLKAGHPKVSLVPLERSTGAGATDSPASVLELKRASPSRSMAATTASFTNWENPVVHPVDLSPDGTRLAVVNLPDSRIEIFDLVSGDPVHSGAVQVGVDPVSVRFRTADELWAANHISDSVSVVDLTTMTVVDTIQTLDEPADIVFAGTPERAFVSASQVNTIQVFDPVTRALVADVPVDAEDPRSLSVSPDGSIVYAAIFESGNKTTYVLGDTQFEVDIDYGTNDPEGPYGGQNPAPNDGTEFDPPIAAGLPTPPEVTTIVRQSEVFPFGWFDDNGGDWTRWVTGDKAGTNFRGTGWFMPDRDIAVIDTATLEVEYATGLMNLCMSMAVNPQSGEIVVVGTDATNETRFEPNLNGTFVRTKHATVAASDLSRTGLVDLNDHLDYTVANLPQSERDKSLADPRGVAINSTGSKVYITGMGSNNMIVVNPAGTRVGAAPTIELGEGPTGIVLDEPRNRAYVLNRFEASLSVVDTVTETELQRIPFYDPTPDVIRAGRPHLYDAHATSGLGQAPCAGCHVDARMDRLAWDLGNPQGTMTPLGDRNLANNIPDLSDPALFDPYHPMKGPMMTQTLQDIIGHEPFHFRGDKNGLEEFNPTYTNLQGDDAELTPAQMQEFEDFLATVAYPPNPFRNFDNSLSRFMFLTGHQSSGRFADQGGLPLGWPMLPGNAERGMVLYRGTNGRKLDDDSLTCVTCHALPTGAGSDQTANGLFFEAIPPGPNGENHVAISGSDGFTNRSMKIQGFRNIYEKVGMEITRTTRAGFGFGHQGRVPDLAHFLGGFTLQSDQEMSDVIAFMLSLSGSDLPGGSVLVTDLLPEGVPSLDTHAAAGKQVTMVDTAPVALFGEPDIVAAMLDLARTRSDRLELIAQGTFEGRSRGFYFDAVTDQFLSDRSGQVLSVAELAALASPATPLTYTMVPAGSGRRLGINRDEDAALDDDDCNPADETLWIRSPDVNGLQLSHSGDTTLSWTAAGTPPDISYEVIGGSLSDLGSLGLAEATSCIADGLSTTSWTDTRPSPLVGQAYFYLTRSRNSCGPGDAGDGRESLRDVDCP
ncbi:hypothetical protein ABI59_17870 [Acidobacteria bacterium Mor1]|nr:hypothetical protein ABI59_17870 [Acidobacteria bacterium Mor1]